MDFLSVILKANILIDSSNDYEFWIELGGGIFRRIKETHYFYRTSIGIY